MTVSSLMLRIDWQCLLLTAFGLLPAAFCPLPTAFRFLPTLSQSRDPPHPRQRNSANRRGFRRQCRHILRLKMVYVRLTAGPSQHLNLRRHHAQKVGNAFRRLIDVQASINFGSCVVTPTGHRPVWQWWQYPGSVPS